MKMRFLWIVLFSIFSLIMHADTVSLNQAREYAEKFFSRTGQSRSKDVGLTLVWEGTQKQSRSSKDAALYVFNRENNNGFIIISGNDATKPVLAYTYEGSFDPDNMPVNVRAWMRALEEGVIYQGKHSSSHSRSVADEWNRVTAPSKSVELDTPNWDQEFPYNKKCPVVENMYCYPGCANTATAIVMGYHQWPESGIGTLPKYTTKAYSLKIPALSLGEEYLWSKMPYINNNPEDFDNQESTDAVATLMYHVAVMGKADFSPYGTGTYLGTVGEALPVYMKYSPRISYLKRKDYTQETWYKKLRDEIDAKRPVVYEGFDEETGHAFVIDGYDDQNYFSVNWGWGGRYNGFYSLDDMAPGLGGTGASGSGTYNLLQGGLFGVEPRYNQQETENALEFTENAYYAPGLRIGDIKVPARKGDSFSAEAGLVLNVGTNIVNGLGILAMTDAEGTVIEEFSTYQIRDLEPGRTSTVMGNKTFYTIQNEVKPGYRLRVFFKPDLSEEYLLVKCEESLGKWEFVLHEGVPEDSQTIAKATSLSYNRTTGLLTLETLEGISVQLKREGSDKDYSSAISYKGNTLVINSNLLEKGIYILELKKGSDLKKLKLEF